LRGGGRRAARDERLYKPTRHLEQSKDWRDQVGFKANLNRSVNPVRCTFDKI